MSEINQPPLPGFEPAPPTPPANGSRAYEALRLLAMFGEKGLTTPEALQAGNGWRLAASVNELHELGWQILAHRVPASTARNRIARHFLAGESVRHARALLKGGCL